MKIIPDPHIAFIGDLTVDRYVEKKESRLGGGALNCAIWAKRVGAIPSVVTAIGNDEEGKQFLEKLTAEQIDGTHIRMLPGVTSSIEIFINEKGERRYGTWNPGTLKSYHLNESDEQFLKNADVVCATVYPEYTYILDELLTIKKEKRDTPRIVINFGDLREFGGDPLVVWKYLPLADILVFGLDKDCDEKFINELGCRACTHNKIIVVTLGAKGSLLYAGCKTFAQTAKLVKVVDTTGAGDAFLSGFLASYLKTLDLEESLHVATDLASTVVGHIGAY